MSWARGEPIAIRYVNQGRLRHAHAAVVAEDGPSHFAAYVPVGAEAHWSPVDHETGHTPPPRRSDWHTHSVLQLFRPDRWSNVWCMWRADDWRFVCWYVNFQTPMRRTAIGIDTGDLSLDLVVEPDLGWHWKDEDHFEQLQGHGLIGPDEAAAVLAEGRQVIRDIETRAWPFTDDWPDWRPDPSFAIPALPADWRITPV